MNEVLVLVKFLTLRLALDKHSYTGQKVNDNEMLEKLTIKSDKLYKDLSVCRVGS